MAKGKVLETVVNIAGEISPTLGKSIKGVTDKLEGVNLKAVAVSAAVVAIGSAAAKGLEEAGKYMAKLGDDFNKATNDIAAQTGAAGAELEDLSNVMKEVYGNNFGESMEEVAQAVSDISKMTGLAGDELQSVTEGAFALSDTFGYDVSEIARAAKAMMTNFGISGDEAMNLIASGAQNGLDFSGELIDSINEYSVQFAKVGMDADDMFQIFSAGAENGAWNLDKVGDAMKEFSIRSIDGSKTTIDAFNQLGLDADTMMGRFAEGGEIAKRAFKQVANSLIAIKDPVARDAVGVELFGTMWEDLGVEAVAAMAGASDAAYATGDELKGITEVKYDNIGDAFGAIKRQIEVGLMPASSSLAQSLGDLAPQIGDMVAQAMPYLENLANKIGPFISDAAQFAVDAVSALGDGIGWVKDNADWLLPVIGGLTAAFVAYKAITLASTAATNGAAIASNIMAGAQKALNLVMSMNPIGLIIAAIAGLIAAFVLLWNNCEGFRNFWIGIWESINGAASAAGEWLSGVWENISTGASNLVEGIKTFFSDGFQALVGIVKAPINAVISIINGAISAINSIGFDIPDWVPIVGGKKFSINIPEIPLLASGGLTEGVSIAGEAGTEAVISFDQRYRAQNIGYWSEAGKILGVLDDDFSLSGTSGGDTIIDMGGIEFAPNITINGYADKQTVIEAIEDEYPEFLDLLERWFAERGLPVYG